MIPSAAECFDIIERHGMLDNIRAHSVVVTNIAALMTEGVNRAGGTLSMKLVVAAALLHDIGKTPCLDNGRDHAELGREICAGLGYPEVADIVGDHVCLLNYRAPDITENEVVFYADKRVNHDSIVSLKVRERYIIERYGRNIPAKIEAIRKNCLKWQLVEKHLFDRLDFHPDELAEVADKKCSLFDFSRTQEQSQTVHYNCTVSDL